MANIVVSALSTFNNKGLKKGKKEISIFEKQLKSFQRTFLAAFSVTALTRFSKEAVKAFVADEKAAKSLEQQLKNTGYQFSAPGVELYIANLQKATGVLDDELRPAFQQLLTVTGSITTSQDALNTAINVSAATGKSLAQVTQALSRAYAGNTTGLSRLGAGLSKSLLKAGDMNKIMAELNNKFSGQAAARLETYAGKMDLLKVASENVKEEIGEGILDSLALLSKDTSIQTATTQMEDFGTAIGDAIYGMAKLINRVNDLGVVSKSGGLGNILLALQPGGRQAALLFNALRSSGIRPRELPANEQRSAGRIYAQQFRTEVKQKKEMERLRAQEIANAKKKTAVDKLKDQFDLERIGYTKALNEATDKETKLRLEAQIAILDNNEALAKKILAEMEGKKAADEVTTSLYALSKAAEQLILSFGVNPNQIGPGGTITGSGGGGNIGNLADISINNPYFGYSDAAQQLGLALGFTPAMTQAASPEIRITVDTSSAGDKLSQAIAETIQIATKTGYSTVPAGQGF